MGKRVNTAKAAELTGLTKYALYKRAQNGQVPAIWTSGLGKGRLLFDIEQLEEHLRKEAMNNTTPAPASNVIQYGQVRKVSE